MRNKLSAVFMKVIKKACMLPLNSYFVLPLNGESFSALGVK